MVGGASPCHFAGLGEAVTQVGFQGAVEDGGLDLPAQQSLGNVAQATPQHSDRCSYGKETPRGFSTMSSGVPSGRKGMSSLRQDAGNDTLLLLTASHLTPTPDLTLLAM